MKKTLIILFTLSFIQLHAQTNVYTCNKSKTYKHKVKSNTLPLNYIQETEKYDVIHYDLDLKANNMNTNLVGTVKMTAIANENIDTVIFELFPSYTIDTLLVNQNTALFSWRETGIHCKVNVKKGEKFTISTSYSGKAPDESTNPLGGAGYSQKQSPSWKKNVSWTLSEPFSAYEWFPCKQSLTDKIDSVSIKITVPDSCMAGSNGLLQNITSLPNNQKCFYWKHLQPIDYYLISFSVANYIDYSLYAHPKDADSILIQNYVYPNALAKFKDQIDNTADFIEYYSDIYSLYPFQKEKYGHCMAPISGGMEHQTMTTLGFFDEELVAHELAHQWWGDHVTCGSWSDIWLNEGFATYSEYLMLAKLFPGSEKGKLNDIHNSVLSVSNGSTWVKDSLNENSIFSRELVYDKGAAIIHTLRYIIQNDALFFQALRNYQSEFGFKTATASDFKKSVEKTTGIDLTNYFNEWYYGEGYPTYAAKLIPKSDNTVELTVTHKGSAPNITPCFTNPIDIRISRTNKTDTIIRVAITSNLQKTSFSLALGLKEVIEIDPTNFIVNRVEQFTNHIDTMHDNILIYPNPTQDFITIELKNPMNATVKLISIDGKILIEKTFSKETQLDIRNQSPGSYILVIDNEGRIFEQKIAKN
jgi:aminopeptidase N